MVTLESLKFQRIEFLHNFDTYQYRYAFGEAVDEEILYGIPMCAKDVMKLDINKNKISFLKRKGKFDFDYTGGCYDAKRRCVWGIPRNSNSLLCINVDKDEVSEIPLQTCFESEGIHGGHHYTGVLVKDSIYCAPRHKSSGILKINLETMQINMISLDELLGFNSHYSGTILHPNGYIYFTPSVGNYFLKLDPRNDNITFLGEKMQTTIFGGCIYNSDIYSYTSHGIIKVDIKKEEVMWLHKFENKRQMYGTILHPNGCIYSWGSGNQFVEYDINKQTYNVLATIYDINNAFIYNAGGMVLKDKNIYFTPCQGRFVMRAVFG